MNLVSSNLVRRKNMSIDMDIYNKWMNLLDNSSKITKAIFKDWYYCNKGNKLQSHKKYL